MGFISSELEEEEGVECECLDSTMVLLPLLRLHLIVGSHSARPLLADFHFLYMYIFPALISPLLFRLVPLFIPTATSSLTSALILCALIFQACL